MLKLIKISNLQSGKGDYPSINLEDIKNLRIPLPPVKIQNEIVSKIEKLETKRHRNNEKIKNRQKKIKSIIKEVFKIYPKVKVGDKLTLEYGKSLPKNKRVPGEYPVAGSNGIDGWHNEFLVKAPAIVVGRKGSAGKVNLFKQHCYPIDTTYYVKLKNPKENIIFYFYIFSSF